MLTALPHVYTMSLYIYQLVRVSLAENIATLAETAVRFLELSQVAASADVQVCLHFIAALVIYTAPSDHVLTKCENSMTQR